jgi:hypothetical protein
VLLAWRSNVLLHGAALSAGYFSAVFFWILAGCVVLLTGVIRFAAGKMKAGASLPPHKPSTPAPATQRGE